MSNHPQLESLIQSMSGAEKRYFKLNALKNNSKGSSRYLALFEAVSKGKDLAKSPGENRSVTTAYLYDSILQNLDGFHEKGSINSRIDRLIRNATVLYERGLNEQSLKLFLKAEAVAWQQQEYVRCQTIYWYMRNLLAINTESHESALSMAQVLERNLTSAKEIELMARLRFVQHGFHSAIAEAGSITPSATKTLTELVDSQAMHDVNDHSGFFSQITANHILGQFAAVTNNPSAGLLHGKKVFDLCFSHRPLLQEKGRLMMASANNYMMRCIRAKDFTEMKRVLDILELEKSKVVSAEMIRLETYYCNMLSYLILSKQFDSDEILGKVESDLAEFGGKMNQAFVMYIYELSSQFAFFKKDYRTALRWINQFLNNDNRTAFSKNLSVAFDYRLLIYYEQGKLDLLEAEINFKESNVKNLYPELRNAIRTFLKKELSDGGGQKQNLLEFQKSIEALMSNDLEPEGREFFPWQEWVSTRLKK
ncbi:MAG: hypothetical protein ACI85F_001779 [Bacteroidia bacterium]|jgi:hypothetical protein